MDGSFHEWYERRGPKGCLMNLVDDATGTTLVVMGVEETIWTAVGVLRRSIKRYGLPVDLYTDWKTVYVKEATERRLLRGQVSRTQFGSIRERLGIRIIAANSPRAKGRVERDHRTHRHRHRHRLVKKLRRKKIGNHESANEYLRCEYLPDHNRRFAHEAASPEDYHHKKPNQAALDEVFRLETERVIGNDWVVRYGNRFLQVNRQGNRQAPAKGNVVVREWQNGRLEIRYRRQKVSWKEIAERPQRPEAEPARKVARV
jgi:hypothetical protein